MTLNPLYYLNQLELFYYFTVICPSQETEETSIPTRPVENVVLTTKGLQEKIHTNVGWDDGGKIGKIIN